MRNTCNFANMNKNWFSHWRMLSMLVTLPIVSMQVLSGQTQASQAPAGQIAFVQPISFRQQEAELVISGGSLRGTLFIPNGVKRPPVVLIIAGSGPTDRDGNSPMLPGKNNSLLQLADSLATQGIASLRYDKRGVAKSQIKGLKEEQMVFSDGVDDVIGWIRWLRQQGFRKIFIAGHSEGSLVGLIAAQTEKINGFISIAGVGRSIDKVLREQIGAGAGPDSLKKLAGRYLDTLLMGQRIVKPNPMLLSIFRPSVQPYMISWLSYDPQVLMRSLPTRAIILQGTFDLQVKETDAHLLAKANPKAKLVIIPQMNHVLKKIETTGSAENIASYSNPNLPVMAALVEPICSFVKGKFN